jgi:vacuolar-type H+-ATPase subunit H
VSETSTGSAPANDASLDALRQLKAAESAWSEKVAKAKADAESELAALKASAEAAVQKARADAETARAERVKDAKFKADVEAESVLRDGEKEAAKVASSDPARASGFGAQAIDAVLGAFRVPGGKKGA